MSREHGPEAVFVVFCQSSGLLLHAIDLESKPWRYTSNGLKATRFRTRGLAERACQDLRAWKQGHTPVIVKIGDPFPTVNRGRRQLKVALVKTRAKKEEPNDERVDGKAVSGWGRSSFTESR